MQKSHSWFFYLCALEGAAAIAALFLIPSEGDRLSLARLTLISFLAVICVAWMYLGLHSPRGFDPFARPIFIAISAILALAFSLFLFLLRYFNPAGLFSTYQRLSPLLWYFLILSIQFSLFLLFSYRGFHPAALSSRKPIYLSALSAFCSLLLIFLFISVTRLGLTPDPAYWSEPGVPLLGWQFALSLVSGVGVLLFTFSARTHKLKAFLPLAIYLLAVGLWLSVPADVLANSFYMPINPPNFQPFPYSDSGYYDQMAHSLLIGHPYQGQIPTRPLYIVLLSFLHLLFGENYRNIIIGQTFLLATIPVVFYFLGKKLHSRLAGVIIALFFIFRELTTLLVSSNTRVSNTKTLLVDLPTLLLLILACLFTSHWLEQKDRKSALIAGGAFGLLLLLRTQSMLVLPFVLLAALLVFGWRSKLFYLLTSFFLLGLLVTIVPWLARNYLQTGQFAFDAAFQYKVIASQYAYSGNLDINNFDFEGKGLGRVLIEFALKDPAFVFGFISNHFLASQVHGLLALPLIKPYHGIFEPVNLYWMEWNGSLEWYNVILLIFDLAVIALGLGSAWKRWRWIGLLPLAFSLGYALATAIGRFSGWRYDLPADWIYYFYFGIGFAEILIQAALLLGAKEEQLPPARLFESAGGAQKSSSFAALIPYAFLFAFLGALPWLAENIASPRYADQSQQRLEQALATVPNAPPLDEISTFASQPESFLQTGRLVYPRFFSKNNGLASTNPWPAYAIHEYPRIGFLLLNQGSVFVVFPTKRLPEFPHAEDAIILGCQRDGYVEARWIVFPELDSIYESNSLTETCSP
jgi:4-amino-4-deoxy-L-arabinose transferase-like glycosyltransferase